MQTAESGFEDTASQLADGKYDSRSQETGHGGGSWWHQWLKLINNNT